MREIGIWDDEYHILHLFQSLTISINTIGYQDLLILSIAVLRTTPIIKYHCFIYDN